MSHSGRMFLFNRGLCYEIHFFTLSIKLHVHSVCIVLYYRVIELILARVGCKNARACMYILKPTSANIHQYQFNNSFIIQLKHFSINLHEFSVKFISNSYVYCISRQSVQYQQPHFSTVQYATGYMRRFCGKVRKIMVNLIKNC